MLTVLSRLRERAPISMIFVAHNYGHVLNFCDRVNLVQDGCIALDKPTSKTSIEELTSW